MFLKIKLLSDRRFRSANADFFTVSVVFDDFYVDFDVYNVSFHVLLQTVPLAIQTVFSCLVLIIFLKVRLYRQHIWSSGVPLVRSEIDNRQQLIKIVPLGYTWPIYPHMPTPEIKSC